MRKLRANLIRSSKACRGVSLDFAVVAFRRDDPIDSESDSCAAAHVLLRLVASVLTSESLVERSRRRVTNDLAKRVAVCREQGVGFFLDQLTSACLLLALNVHDSLR
jgi:hypothetical protein